MSITVETYATLPEAASAMRQDVHKAMEAGMNDYSSKPFVPKDLRQKILSYTSKVKS